MKRICFLILAVTLSQYALAQSSYCLGLQNPTTFFGWYGRTGIRSNGVSTGSTIYNTSVSGTNITGDAALSAITTTGSCGSGCNQGSAPDNNKNRFQIITQQGTDYHSGNNFNRIPQGYTSCIRLGDMCSSSGNSAEALYYEMTVSPENALVFIDYACVMEAPTHGPQGNPEFIIRVCKATTDASGNVTGWESTPMNDSLYYIVQAPDGTTNLPQGWSANTSGGCQYVYKPWTKVAINLYNYLYQTIRIELYISDCTAEFHGAYCYIAGSCRPMRLNANGCAAGESDTVATINAPGGLASYMWLKSSTGQTTSRNEADFVPIANATDSILRCRIDEFVCTQADNTRDTVEQQTFMCKMTSYMDPAKPISSTLTVDVGNMKPTISVDTMKYCNGDVELIDKSFVKFTANDDNNRVDTANIQWKIYETAEPSETTSAITYGPSASYNFTRTGRHAIKVKVSAYDTTCWNEKTIHVNSLSNPIPRINIPRNDLCAGDEITLIDETTGPVSWRQWILHHEDGTHDTMNVTGAGFNHAYDVTETVELRVRNNFHYTTDTNLDGHTETIYCEANTQEIVRVGGFAELEVTGDTIVCLGTQAVVNVNADIPGCTFDWFHNLNGTTPFQSGVTMTDSPIADMKYYVRSTTPNGCISWDSMNIYLIEPELEVPITEMCDGESVQLHGSNAYSYTWTSMPDDPSLAGQENSPDIVVSPNQTTTYTLVGHGMNNCNANPLNSTITVYPYPIPTFEMNPGFIDSEEPLVTFRDVSPNSTSSLWDFGNGETSTDRQVKHTFTDLTQDSIQITLTTGNALGCSSDTSFYVPVTLFSAWFPNAITPTLSTNRTFKVYTHNELEYYSLYIYNRAGELVFISHDQNEEWDGTYKGHYCDQGVYVYLCSYRRPGTVDIVTQRGTLLIIQ